MTPLTDDERLEALEQSDLDQEQRLEALESTVTPLVATLGRLASAIDHQTDRLDKWSLAISGGCVTIIAVLLAKALG